MASKIFIDTSGFFSMLVRADDRHESAKQIVRRVAKEHGLFLTTDYVLDETATLLRARGHSKSAELLFNVTLRSTACEIAWTHLETFAVVRDFFIKHSDQDWSFTDCLSFIVMRENKLQEALTKDSHFDQAGFVALLK